MVGDLMSFDHLPGVAEVAMQSGHYAAKTIMRRRAATGTTVRSAITTWGRWPLSDASGPSCTSGRSASLAWSAGSRGWSSTSLPYRFQEPVGDAGRLEIAFLGRGRPERTITEQQALARVGAIQQASAGLANRRMMRPTPARGRPDPSSRAAADRGVSRAPVACTTMTQGRITSPFTATSTAAEVVAGIDLRDKRVIVTGGSSGIGIETARALASAGADVTLAVRNPDAGARVGCRDQRQPRLASGITVARLDFLDLGSVRNFAPAVGLDTPTRARQQRRHHGPPHWTVPLPDGSRSSPHTHLGHFARPPRYTTPSPLPQARIVSVSSRAHPCSPVDPDDINFNRPRLRLLAAYGQSKTANVLFAVGPPAWAADGITTNAVYPGSIWTNLVRYLTDDLRESLRTDRDRRIQHPPSKEPQTSVFAATSPLLDGIGGRNTSKAATRPCPTQAAPNPRRFGRLRPRPRRCPNGSGSLSAQAIS